MQIPAFRTSRAVQSGVEKSLLLTTWGGIGDQICAEPTLRFALKTFKDCKITLASEIPELFSHLKFDDVYDLRKERPILDDYLVFETISKIESLTWQFMGHMVTNCVDFPSLCAFRCQLPVSDREVVLKPEKPNREDLLEIVKDASSHVVIHAGRHWPSKTFPESWWNEVLLDLKKNGYTPVLIGKEGTDKMDNQGTVQVDPSGCIDLRNKTSLMETVWLLQNMPVVICNDSSPLHMSVTGDAFIGYVATVKHPDFITHWRKGQWSWRMQNFGKGGMWNHMDYCPNKEQTVNVDNVDPELLLSWLPDPKIFAPWCKDKMNEYFK